jgi:tetratricopeptide (TPR) repeat protein
VPRFDRLEFEPSPERPEAASSRPGVDERDHRHWLKQADENRRQGLYENALRYYSRALEQDRSAVHGWVGQVQMLIALGECPEAEVWARKALELFRNHADLLAGRAQALCRGGDWKKAQPLSDAALGQPGESAYRWVVRGELMVAGKQDVDRYCFDKAVQFDADWLVPLEIALIYLHYRLPSKALPRVRQAVDKAPDSAHCWYIQGCCEQELVLNARAKMSLKRCLELVPRHLEAEKRLIELDSGGWSLGQRLRRLLGLS